MPAVSRHSPEAEQASAADSRRQWISLFLTYGALAVFFGASAVLQLRRYPLDAVPAISIYLCLLLLLGIFLVPGFRVSRSWLAARMRGARGVAAGAGLFLFPYLIYSVGTGDFLWAAFAKLLVVAIVAFSLAAVPVRRPRRINWQDLVLLFWLAAPILSGQMRGIWNKPLNLDFMARLFIVGVGSWSFLIWRRLEEVGYEFRFSR